MRKSSQWFVLVAVLLRTAAAQPVAVTIDVTRTGQPITKLMFGGLTEPATTQVGAEMLSDQKFFHPAARRPVRLPVAATSALALPRPCPGTP